MRPLLVFLSLLLLLLPCSTVRAYDVEVDGIFYGLLPLTGLAYVTHGGAGAMEPDSYRGDVVIPETINHGGRTYTVFSVGPNAFACSEGLTSVEFPSSVKAVSACAFLGCTNLRRVSLPPSMGVAGSCAFAACTSLQQMALPRLTERIDTLSFYCCASVERFVLPHRVRQVCSMSMQHLPALTDLYVFASLPPQAEQGAFSKADQQRCTLHVPRQTLEQYRQAAVWSDFARIVPLTDDEQQEQGFRKGDVNADGAVDAADLELLQRIILSLPDDAAVRWAADVNGDGKVNAVDYVVLAAQIAKS